MKLGSLYSGGIDAFSYAAVQCGIEVAWHVEHDEKCHPYLKQNYPNGIPDKIFRLGASGNSIVAPIPVILLKCIMEIEKMK